MCYQAENVSVVPLPPNPLSNVLNDIREGSREMRTISEDCSSVASVGSWRMEMSPASQPHSGEGCGTVTLYRPDMCWGVGKSETMLDPGRGIGEVLQVFFSRAS